jgi:formate dehydrogenase subunit delta
MTTVERLIHMANQIATNLETDSDPVGAIANHIQLFWDPRMKALIRAHGPEGLSVNARQAIESMN